MATEFDTGSPRKDLSNQRSRDANIADYFLPVEEIPFALAIPDRGATNQPSELFELVSPHVPRDIMRLDGEVVILQEDDKLPQFALQYTSESLVARELIGSPSDELIAHIRETVSPEVFDDMIARGSAVDGDLPVVAGWGGWISVMYLRHTNESYRVLSHAMRSAPSGAVKIERHEVENYTDDRLSLNSATFTCSFDQANDGSEIIRVNARLPWGELGSDDYAETSFELRPDGMHVSPDEIDRLRAIGKERGHHLWMHYTEDEPEIQPSFWDDVSHSLINRGEHTDPSSRGRSRGPYILTAFGQELSAPHCGYAPSLTSIRVFDSQFEGKTIRTQDEVDQEIYFTTDEAAQEALDIEDFERYWTEEIVPKFKDWTPEQIRQAAEYITTHHREVGELLQEKLQGDTRLAIVGMTRHPHFDHLPFNVLEEVDGVDFIALDLRQHSDKSRGIKEDREGMTKITLDNGVVVKMSHQQAREKFLERYRDPDERDSSYDNVIAEAEARGIRVLYVRQGETWEDVNKSAAETIARHMETNPQAKGVYFTSVYSALKWPGYTNDEERDNIGFSRPLTVQSMFEYNPQNDPSVRMPAYALEEQFPGQIYSVAQFVMPEGFGKDWQNLRNATTASGLKERFALDNIADTPFAVQRYMFRGLVELEGVPDEELSQWFGTMAEGFFGPVEFRWDKVFDGIIVSPSDNKLPPEPTPKQLAEAVGTLIKSVL